MLRKLLLLYFFSLVVTTCFGQLPKLESKDDALNELKKSISDSTRQFVYNFLGVIYLGNAQFDKKMFDSSFYYLRKAVYLGDSINRANKEITNETLRWLALSYMWFGDLVKSKQIYLQVIANYKQHNQKKDEADTWYTMAKEFRNFNVNFQETPRYFENAIWLYDQEKLYLMKAESLVEEMVLFFNAKDYMKVEELAKRIIMQGKANHLKHYSDVLIMLAGVNRNGGRFDKALEYALEAAKYVDSSENRMVAIKVYGELALTYEVLGETEKSVFWYSKSIAEREKNGSEGIGVYRTLCLMIKQMVKEQKGAEGIIQLEEMRKKNPPTSHQQKAILAQSFAYCYSEMKQYKHAESQFIEMITEYKQSRVEQEILFIGYYDISKFYVDNNEYSKAETYLSNDILKMAGPSITISKDVCLLKFKVDSAKGDLLSALKYYQDYKALNDSAFTEAKSRQINELMIKYESEKKDNDINNLETTATLQNAKLVQATQTRNWTLGVALLLFIIISLLMRNSWIKQQTNMKLEAQQKEIQTQNTSLQHLVQEKDWLVKEIHHRVKNNFHTVIGLLGTQSGYLKNAEAIGAIADSQQRIQAMSLIHQKLYQSDSLSDIDMADYIHELVDYLKSATNTGKRILFHFNLDPIDLDVYHAVPIGLILNETITNAIKYAFPDNRNGIIRISFTANDDNENNILLVLTDDGMGLPAGFSNDSNSTMGMNLMQGLAKDIDGHFTIDGNKGTTVKVAFTYHRNTPNKQGILIKGTPQTI